MIIDYIGAEKDTYFCNATYSHPAWICMYIIQYMYSTYTYIQVQLPYAYITVIVHLYE